MSRIGGWVGTAALLAMLVQPGAARGQGYSSIGAGVVVPTSGLADLYDRGYTLRGQTGLSLVFLDAHIQTGYTAMGGKTVTIAGQTETFEDIDFFHVGLGARVGLGVVWVGANAAYFFGDLADGLGFFPEAGVGLGPVEVVADYRLDGDANWLGVRLGWRY